MRARLAPAVAAGTVRCARCGELIGQGEKWELDHRDDGRGWLGPSHQRCNARAGWRAMVDRNGSAAQNGTTAVFEETPYRWSRRWHDTPPVGTTALVDDDGRYEVHLGAGVWRIVDPVDP
jgi:hypothetical protein